MTEDDIVEETGYVDLDEAYDDDRRQKTMTQRFPGDAHLTEAGRRLGRKYFKSGELNKWKAFRKLRTTAPELADEWFHFCLDWTGNKKDGKPGFGGFLSFLSNENRYKEWLAQKGVGHGPRVHPLDAINWEVEADRINARRLANAEPV